ncbi:MAG: hypothetical protein ACRENK_16485 [Gemmatimonadaceae bacterium]
MSQPQQIAINTLPFWSRFTNTIDMRYNGTDLLRTVMNTGLQRIVFDYRKGEQNVSALEGSAATARDTILVQANQTRGGGMYHIFGISYTKDGWAYERSGTGSKNGIIHTFYPPSAMQPGNGGFGPVVPTVEDWRAVDSLMTHFFLDNFRTQVNIDGTRRILEMGPAPYYPGVGGAFGGNVDTQNGGTFITNYMHIQEGITWNPAGAVDSNFQILLECTYDVVVPTWTTPDGVNPFLDPPAPYVGGANPTAIGRVWTQGYLTNLHGQEESPTSNVS